jgi:hypothetical protein
MSPLEEAERQSRRGAAMVRLCRADPEIASKITAVPEIIVCEQVPLLAEVRALLPPAP